jgi:nucleoside-diphosphate-sugar epimerase
MSRRREFELAMDFTEKDTLIAGSNDRILVTGAAGFIGCRVVNALLEMGFRNLRCLTRPSSKMAELSKVLRAHRNSTQVEIVM